MTGQAARRALVTGASGALGQHFARTLARSGMRVALGARRVETLRRTVSEIVHERRPITPDMAIRLARAFPNQTADFWLSMQAAVDIWDAEQSRSADYKRIRPLASRRSGLMV